MPPRSKEELDSYGIMDPALEAEVKKNPIRTPHPSDPYYGRDTFQAQREHRAAVLREKHHLRYIPAAIPEVREEDRAIPVRGGATIPARIYTPVRPPGAGSPLIVMYHEGGWSMGDLSDEEVNCRLFARDLGAVCVNVDYRLAPEHKFPTGIQDCWDALQWAARNAEALHANPTRGFVVGGGSAGGNIAAVLAHVARDENLSPPLTGQYLCVPAIMCLQPPAAIPARYRAEYLSSPAVTPNQDPVLNVRGEGPGAFIDPILQPDWESPLFVPFSYGLTETGHRGLPPAYLQVCGLDPLRDEGLIYERVLREESGVRTRLDVYPGFGHYFWTNWPALEMSRRFVEDTREGVRWLLAQVS